MARPTTKRRLRDIDPDIFSRDVAERYMNHLVTLLGEHVRNSLIEPVDVLKTEAALLATYAKNGDGVSLVRAKTSYVAVRMMHDSTKHNADPTGFGATGPAGRDTDTVLLAADARLHLDCDQAVPVRELACLAGVDPDHVRLLGRQGEIAIIDGVIAPQDAKRWLAARGVKLPS